MVFAKRSEFAHYLNVSKTATKEWKREGLGVDSLSMAYNGQVDQIKDITQDNATAVFNNYQIQSAVTKRISREDEVYGFINEARRETREIYTQLLEIDTKTKNEQGHYEAMEYDVLIVINEFLGENATISYDIYVQGNPRKGTVTIADKVPTFVEDAD